MSSFVDVRLPRDVETGNYDLEMSLLDIERQRVFTDRLLGQVHVVGRPHEFEIPPITHSLKADFGGQVTLLGYDLDLSQLGESGQARLTLYWQAQKEMETAYQVFVHLLDEAGQIVGQVDREPQGGEAPTTGWLAGEVVVDEIPISVKEAIVATQSIALGVYDPLTGKRLPLLDIDGEAVGDNVTISIR
jgi:hypothetical protein